jgi:virginiamycin B lyase
MQFGSGTKAPLFYVSGSQVNLQVPWELAGQSQVPVTATVNGQTSAPRTANIVPFSPGIFTINAQGTGQGAILDASYHMVDASNAAIPGSTVLQIFCTGLGAVTNQPQTGFPAPTSTPLAETRTTPTVTIGGVSANVLFSGLAPGFVGEYQVNALVPATALAGSAVPVAISIGGVTSNTVTIAVMGPTGTGTLDVQITGPPAGTPVNVSITSTNGYSTTITTASASLQVPSGTYTITASPVAAGSLSYYASAQQTVNVAPGATANAQIAYDTVIPNTTKVLDQTGTSTLTIASDGSTLTMSSQSPVAASLAPGDVLAAAPTPAAPHGLLRKIVSIAQAAGQVTATTTQAALTDAIQQADLQFSAYLLPQNVTSATTLLPGVEVRVGTRPAGARISPTGLLSAVLPMDASDICANGQVVLTEMKQVEIASGLNVSGEIELCGNFAIQGSINWLGLQLNSLTAAATFAEHTDLSVTGQSAEFSGTQTIATINFPDIVIPVGEIPLDFAPEITIKIGASGAAGASFSVGVSQNTSVTRGFSYANGQVSPVLQSTPLTFQLEPLTITPNGHLTATAFVEADIDLLLYHIAGPYFSPQAYLQFDADVLQNPWWTLSGGLKGPVGLQLNPELDVLGFDNLPAVSFADLFDISQTFLQASSGFPSLQALTPNAAPSGSPSLTLTVTGSNFVKGSTLSFGGASLATTFVSPSQLTATVPASDLASAGAFPVTVSNPAPGGGTSAPLTFTVQVGNPQPIIASLSPPAASVGSGPLTLTINGSGFIASSTVTFNGASHAATFVNSGQLTIALTASDLGAVGTFAVIVSNPGPGGGPSHAATFTVQAAGNPPPAITSLSPSSAPAGSSPLTLTINGSGFIASSTVTFNGVSHPATFVNSGQLTIALTTTDLGTVGSFPVVVSNPTPGGGASNAMVFAVVSSSGPVSVSITEYPVPTTNVFIQANGNPYGITAGPDGALWFTEGMANKIGRITTAGAFTEYPVPTPNSGLDPITAGPDGALWFTEGFAMKIGKITTGGVITEYPVPSSANPYGITAGPDGAVWFTEDIANNIGRITTAGAITEYPIPTPNSQPIGITAGPDGALWFTESDAPAVGRITTAGAITEYPVSTFGGPLWITAGPDGALWFTEANAYPQQIGRITTDGVLTEYPVPTPCCDVVGITLGPDGALWFAEQTAGNIGRITTAGVVTEYTAPTGLSGPYGIAAGPDGAIWFTEYWGNKIGRAGLGSSAVTPALQGLSLSSTAVTGGTSFAATVTLTSPAPAGGVQITIQDSPAILQVNSPVTILAGQTTGTFTITAPVVASSTTVTITASLAGSAPVSASLVISPATSAGPFQNSGFDIYGTLNISGQSIPVEVQTLPLSDGTLGVISNSGVSLTIEIEMLFDELYSISGNTITYNGTDPVASSFLNLSTLAFYTSFTSATLSLTVPSPTVGAAVTGTLQFTSSGASLSGTITGTISTVSGP